MRVARGVLSSPSHSKNAGDVSHPLTRRSGVGARTRNKVELWEVFQSLEQYASPSLLRNLSGCIDYSVVLLLMHQY